MRISRCAKAAATATSIMAPPKEVYVAQNCRARQTRKVPGLLVAGVLAGLAEHDGRPALERQLQVDARGGKVDERTAVIERQMVVGARAEFLEPGALARVHPAGGVDRHRIEHALHAVLIGQA